ncbi:hypothetical protein MARGE09_P2906 [Marinagarivorans cellulosilyticus]|uniref:HTH cro/C1-type domain-containing protein n=2 Tax=Marinagarivorans cellulosilyticus TaxID=2721545 RepID=A0AAN1WJH9_9GAMM|nr:hypothetical protein MARGE09_P2906 [Marinagarivorans cellulosilyticus]
MEPSSYSPHYDKLRAWMKQKREESGLSLRAVSEELGRHHSVIGKMEQDRRKIELLEFVEYCRVIGADPHEGLDVMLSKSAENGASLSMHSYSVLGAVRPSQINPMTMCI